MSIVMPNIRGRFSDFIQKQFNLPSVQNNSSSTKRPSSYYQAKHDHENGSFISTYLNGKLNKHHPDILCGKTCYDLPVKEINKLSCKIISAYTGPGDGLANINRTSKPFELPLELYADVDFIDEDYEDQIPQSNENSRCYSSKNQGHLQSKQSQQLFCDNKKINGNIKNNGKQNNHLNNGSRVRNNGIANGDCNDDLKGQSNEDNSNSSKLFYKTATMALGQEIAGITNWNNPSDEAFGIATSLYESHPSTREKAGEPIADSFGICVRENSAILALADGVNWGEKARLAARCAVHGCVDYLNKALYHEGARIENTMDIFVALLRSFHAAHDLILQENGMLTTLCAAVVCQLKNSDKFIVCTCNVGDSLAYVFSKEYGVREITQGSHDIYSMRDMRDALGALGPVDGSNPELNNLTVAMTIVDRGDIVFLTSDGVSDNFDPVVGKFAIPKKEKPYQLRRSPSNEAPPLSSEARRSKLKRSNSNPDRESAHRALFNPNLPFVSAQQRHELTLLRMEDLLYNGVNQHDGPCTSAKQLCNLMIEFSTKLTSAKRRILEDVDLYDMNDVDGEMFDQNDQRQRRRRVGDKLAMVPGKLDHASIVAYKVAFYGDYKKMVFNDNTNNKKYNLKLKATLARFESQDSLGEAI